MGEQERKKNQGIAIASAEEERARRIEEKKGITEAASNVLKDFMETMPEQERSGVEIGEIVDYDQNNLKETKTEEKNKLPSHADIQIAKKAPITAEIGNYDKNDLEVVNVILEKNTLPTKEQIQQEAKAVDVAGVISFDKAQLNKTD